jgi:hypothetical protein
MKLFRAVKRIILWDYPRRTRQYELFTATLIAIAVLIPFNSNGWFKDGEEVRLSDQSIITLHRDKTTIFLTWPEDGDKPDMVAVEKFVRERFGKKSLVVEDPDLGPRHMRIVPGSWW